MLRPCEVCGTQFESKRARYCGPTCRKRASRGYVTADRAAKVIALGTGLPADAESTGPVRTATAATLAEFDRESTPLGQAALVLAARIDNGRDTGAGLAALVKQLQSTLHSATSGAAVDASPLDRARDELAARRASRGA